MSVFFCASNLNFYTSRQFGNRSDLFVSLFQLMTLMVFAFGAISLIGMQFVDPEAAEKVLFIESMYYVPFLPTMQVVMNLEHVFNWTSSLLDDTVR